MTELGRMLMEDGAKKERERLNRLIVSLADAGRTEDIVKGANDRSYQEQLFKEFGIDK